MIESAFNLLRPLLKAALRPITSRFIDDLRNSRATQGNLLNELTGKLAATEYGQSLRVKAGDDYSAFAAKVPIVSHDDINCWIERQISEESNILTADTVLFYEKTSGSSGKSKLIPYTSALKASFNRMFLIWLSDLLSHGPELKTGKLFISISPAFQDAEITARGVRVGLEDDSEYLSKWARALLKPFLVAPSEIRKLHDPDDFKHVLSALLIAESRLETVSVWNPTFLEILLDYALKNVDALSEDLKRGVVSRAGLSFKFEPVINHRLMILRGGSIDWTALWPELKLISCWTSANAQRSASRLSKRFPDVFIQGKGLLATEAPITMPLVEAEGFVPLPSEVFYEFLDDNNQILRMHELEVEGEYEIILTQKGGLWRYRTGDRVRVTHFYEGASCLEFTGRSDAVCDLVGEKLNESFASEQIERLAPECEFYILLPVAHETGACHYLLIVDCLNTSTDLLEDKLDKALCEAYYYRNARMFGQLDTVRVQVVSGVSVIYYDYFIEKGMQAGNVKHEHLIRKIEDATGLIKKMRLKVITKP